MGLDKNDSTIRDLKANLCDFFCQKIRELSEIEDASKKDEYIACLIKVAENADNLSESFEQFELLGIPIKILDISSKKQEVKKKDTSEIEEEREEKANNSDAISETVINASDLNVSENKQVIPMPVKKEVVPDEKSKSVLAPSIRVEAPVLPKMPNIFEGIFNNTRSTDAIEERAPLVNGEQQEMTQKPIVDMPSVSEKKELDLERPMTTQKVVSSNDQVVSIPRVDTVINSNNNNVSNSPISSLLAAYTNGPVGVNESIQNNETNLGNRTRIVKLSSDKVKAILVNKSQMEKLAASLDGQRRLLDFGQDAVMPKQNNIEEMMNRAKQLYNEGKQKEAQQLYDEISQINRANTLVKKAG